MESVDDFSPKTIQATAFVSTASTAFGFKLADGKPRISDTPYGYDVAEGNLTSHESFFRIGYNVSVADTSEDVWTPGGNYVYPPTTGAGFMVLSGSTLDMSTGTGIRTVVVNYLDTSFVEQTTTITLSTAAAGSSAAATNAIRFNSLRADTAGSLEKAGGLVSITATSASTDIFRQIAAGETRARAAIFTVPDGKTLYITDVAAGVGADKAGVFARMNIRANYDPVSETTETFMLPFWEMVACCNSPQHFDIPLKFPEHVDVKMSAVTNQSSGIVVQGVMRGWLEAD